jgi:hypothetical protein
MLESILILLVLLQIKHWYVDFINQNYYKTNKNLISIKEAKKEAEKIFPRKKH